MADNELTHDERTKWRSLYRSGWRVKRIYDGERWMVFDAQGRPRSRAWRDRWLAVAEVVSR